MTHPFKKFKIIVILNTASEGNSLLIFSLKTYNKSHRGKLPYVPPIGLGHIYTHRSAGYSHQKYSERMEYSDIS